MKFPSPGVSTMLIFFPSCSTQANELPMEPSRFRSSGSKSNTEVPSRVTPKRLLAPVLKSMASPREVFPQEPCPTRAMFRMSELWYAIRRASYKNGDHLCNASLGRSQRGSPPLLGYPVYDLFRCQSRLRPFRVRCSSTSSTSEQARPSRLENPPVAIQRTWVSPPPRASLHSIASLSTKPRYP